MDLHPKHSLKSFQIEKLSAVREFTDRDEPTKAFLRAFEQKIPTDYKVLTYYGIGGIGKSRLLKELYKKTEELKQPLLKGLLNFYEEKYRSPGEALICLREEMKKTTNIKFTTFDLAYTIYWKKLNPQLNMKSKENSLPFIEEGSFIGEVINQMENIPLALWVPKTIKLMNSMVRYKEMTQWWLGRGKNIMIQLNEMQPHEIEEMLSVYWAADLQDHLTSNPDTSAIIFIDTYEALWENKRQQGSFHDKDEWVQELVLQLPEVLWVICGREKIHWGDVKPAWNNEQFLEQHLMGELSVLDSDKFLRSCAIVEEEIRRVIIEASQGLPYYLDLMVDTYHLISDKRLPEPKDFSETPHQITSRFFKYLALSEKETLKVLSFSRSWTVEVFQCLVKEYKTGYPLTAYQELFRFSFINKVQQKEWAMHSMMRSQLQDELKANDNELFQQIHTFLFFYYEEKLKNLEVGHITEAEKRFFMEAVYHGKIILASTDFIDWFLNKGTILKSGGHYQFLSSYQEDLSHFLMQEKLVHLQASVHQFYGEIQLRQGDYEKAVKEYSTAISIYRSALSSNQEPVYQLGQCLSDLAEIMIHTNDYDKAYAYLQEGSVLLEGHLAEQRKGGHSTIALLNIRLGKLNIRFSHYAEAARNYNKAIQACDEELVLSEGKAEILALKALAYEKLGELYGDQNHLQQGECYLKSVNFYQQALKTPGLIDYTRTLANMGLAYKRLGEFYSAETQLSEKIKSFKKAIAIYNEVLTASPYFVDALEKKGHASVDYMVLLIEINLLDEAVEIFHEAVASFRKVIELSPRTGGSRNRLASVYRELSKVYIKRHEIDKALAVLLEALGLYDLVLSETPNYIYVYNSLGKTHEAIADVYAINQQPEEAYKHYRLAEDHFDKMLEKAQGLIETLERKERLKQKIASIRS